MSQPLMRSTTDPLFPLMIEQGQLVVCLNNERLAKVLGPGKYRRWRDLPLRGAKRIIRFNTHEISVRVEDVQLRFRDRDNRAMVYPASASATAIVQVNPDRHLIEQAIERFAPDQMEAQVQRTVEDTVRAHIATTLSELTHEEFSGSPDLGPVLTSARIPILDGLLSVVRIEQVSIVPNAELAAVEQKRREALVKIVDAEIEEALADLQSARQSQREGDAKEATLTRWVQVAQATGLPLEVIANPEILSSNAEGRQQVLLELIKNPESLRALSKQPEILRALTGSEPTEAPWPAQTLRPSLEPAEDRLELGFDVTIGRLADEYREVLLGAALAQFAVRASRAAEAVLVARDVDLLQSAKSQIAASVRDATGAETAVVHIVPYHPQLEGFVEFFYRTVAPPNASGYRSLTVDDVRRSGRSLALRLRVDGAYRSVREIVHGESDRRSDLLQSLLMADRLSIETV